MKRIYGITMASALALALTGCGDNPQTPSKDAGVTPADAAKIDQRDVCSVAKHGLEKVVANAKVYNASAIKEGVEFRRLGVNNSGLIASIDVAMKNGDKEVKPKDFKGKASKDNVFSVEYAAERACTFGLAALQYKHEGKSTWRNEVPGDGFKY